MLLCVMYGPDVVYIWNESNKGIFLEAFGGYKSHLIN